MAKAISTSESGADDVLVLQSDAFTDALDSLLRALQSVAGAISDGTVSPPQSSYARGRSQTVMLDFSASLALTWIVPWAAYLVYAVLNTSGNVAIGTQSISTTTPNGVFYNPSLAGYVLSGRFAEFHYKLAAGQTLFFNSTSTGAILTLVFELL